MNGPSNGNARRALFDSQLSSQAQKQINHSFASGFALMLLLLGFMLHACQIESDQVPSDQKIDFSVF